MKSLSFKKAMSLISDIDECASDPNNDCIDNDHCTNTYGSYTCSCPAQFRLKADGRTCQPENQCETNPGCEFQCGRINGVDTCQCPNGKSLGVNGLNCEGIGKLLVLHCKIAVETFQGITFQ